jgi:putative ABC transport system permease protein
MTLAMISLVIFALTMMSAMNLNFDRLFLADEARGGWDVRVIENPNSPLPGLRAALAESGSAAADEIRSAGTLLFAGSFDLWDQLPLTLGTEVSQSGDWENYPVIGVTASMVDGGRIPLDKRAEGYDSDEAVWQAIRDGGNVALIDAIAAQSGFYPSDFALDGIGERDRTFEPVPLRVRDPVSGISREVLIIGVIGLGSSTNFTGVFVPEDTFRGVFGDPQLSIHYVALNDPGRAADAAREIETALVSAGVQAESLKEIADRENAASRNFLYLMQSFMGLGLVVGIAAVGVIAFRTVVERRQQIGMLRAIGYKRSTVALSFLMESAFVTLLGILAGITLALWLSYFLITSDEFPATSAGYAAPWLHIIVIGTLTFLASLLMTWIPSRQAASIPTAEALRYE